MQEHQAVPYLQALVLLQIIPIPQLVKLKMMLTGVRVLGTQQLAQHSPLLHLVTHNLAAQRLREIVAQHLMITTEDAQGNLDAHGLVEVMTVLCQMVQTKGLVRGMLVVYGTLVITLVMGLVLVHTSHLAMVTYVMEISIMVHALELMVQLAQGLQHVQE